MQFEKGFLKQYRLATQVFFNISHSYRPLTEKESNILKRMVSYLSEEYSKNKKYNIDFDIINRKDGFLVRESFFYKTYNTVSINYFHNMETLLYLIHNYTDEKFYAKTDLTENDIYASLYFINSYRKKYNNNEFLLTPREKQVLKYEIKRLYLKNDKTKEDFENIIYYEHLLKNYDFNSFFKKQNSYFKRESR